MRMGPLHDLISDIVTDQLRQGSTSLQAIKATAITQIQRCGGPAKFGYGDAFVYHFMGDEISNVAKAMMKAGLYKENVAQLRINAPPRLAEQLRKLPMAIAISEGRDALWVHTLKATAEQWKMNAEMKAKKAQQTIKQADESMNVAHYLMRYEMTSLSDGLADMDVAA